MRIQVQKFTVLEKDFSMPGGELGEFLHAYQNSLHVVPKIVYTKLSYSLLSHINWIYYLEYSHVLFSS